MRTAPKFAFLFKEIGDDPGFWKWIKILSMLDIFLFLLLI